MVVLLAALRLMHPFAPFITEEIFHLLKEHFAHVKASSADPYTQEAIQALLSPACIVSAYPELIRKEDIRPEIEEKFQFMNEIVYAIRNIRAEMGLPPSTSTDLLVDGSGENMKLLEENEGIITSLVRINAIKKEKPSGFHSSADVRGLKLIIPLPQELLEKEKKRLEKEKEKCEQQVGSTKKQLSNPNFVERAPKELVEKTQKQLQDLETQLKSIEDKLSGF